MTSASRIPLVPFARELAEEHPGEEHLYSRLSREVRNGRVPAVQVNGRWLIDPADKLRIKAVLGLAVPATPPAPRAARRSATAAVSAAVPV